MRTPLTGFQKATAVGGVLLVAAFLAGRQVGLSADKPAGCARGQRVEAEPAATRTYRNQLTPLENPQPLLADYPEYVEPVIESRRFEAPTLIDEAGADLSVRAWRFSYNARGIVEVPNRIRADKTAVIMVHPWGIDDGQGWTTPEPAGVADFCTVEKNELAGRHTAEVVNPLLKRLRDRVNLVLYSMRGGEHPAHKAGLPQHPASADRRGARRRHARLCGKFSTTSITAANRCRMRSRLPGEHVFKDYFRQFPGIDASAKYNHEGFWNLPTPVCSAVDVDPDDVRLLRHRRLSRAAGLPQSRRGATRDFDRICDGHVFLFDDRGL